MVYGSYYDHLSSFSISAWLSKSWVGLSLSIHFSSSAEKRSTDFPPCFTGGPHWASFGNGHD